MRHLVSRDADVSHAVPRRPGGEQRADARGVRVAHAPAGASLRARIWRHSRREVVRLRGEQQVQVHLARCQGRGAASVDGAEGCVRVSADSGGVVLEGDDGVVPALAGDCVLHHLEEALRLGHSINDEVPAEEPMPAMLRVGLPHIKELHICGVTAHVVPKEREVKFKVLLIEGQPHLLVHALKCRATLGQHGHQVHLLGHGVGDESGQGLVVHTLGHAIVHHCRKGNLSLF
mmetsp:Transcript_8264/g.20507  ORF Transcript_8264/g.20507 Transcript_8264/m.20507 type:complete len:232 (-) Transcript_8264:518-1213(-)